MGAHGRMLRIDKDLDRYLREMSKQTGLSIRQSSKIVADSMEKIDLRLSRPGRKKGMALFDGNIKL